jgi:Tfp pilus assembly protein PilN
MDLHKEIKLSDLFRRGSKSDESGAEKAPKAEKPPKEKRKKEPKPPKERKQKAAAVAAHEAPPLPEIPLMRAFNLLPKEEARQAKEGAQSPMPYVLVALAGVLVFAALAAFYLMSGTDVTRKKGQVEDLRAELAAYQATAKDSALDGKATTLAAERAGRRSALATALGNRLAWDRVLREIALVVPDDVRLTIIQGATPLTGAVIAPDGSGGNDLTLTGTVESHASVAEFMARLSVIPEVASVRLKEAATSTNDPSRVAFTITASLRRGP